MIRYVKQTVSVCQVAKMCSDRTMTCRFCYVELASGEEVEKKLKEKLTFPDPENPGEEKEAVFRKFDSVPGIDLLIKKIGMMSNCLNTNLCWRRLFNILILAYRFYTITCILVKSRPRISAFMFTRKLIQPL